MRRTNWWLHGVSLAATAWFVWVNSVAPRVGLQPIGSMIAQAFVFLMLAGVAATLTALASYIVVSRGSGRGRIRDPWSSVGVAVWYAPAAFLAASFTPVSLGASLILIVSATRLLAVRWLAVALPERMQYTPASVFWWRVGMAALASLAIHGGFVAYGSALQGVSALLFGFAAAIFTALAIVTGAHTPRREPELPNAVLGLILTIFLAAGITLVRVTGGIGGAPAAPAEQPVASDGTFPGVVLRPKLMPAAIPKIDPPTQAFVRRAGNAKDPLSIPFTGEYWLYRPPMLRPPALSFFRDGTPAEHPFHTSDGRPLTMEARQKLQEAIALTCCASIDVALITQDLVPRTAFLQLQLFDSRRGQFFRIDLGTNVLAATGLETVRFAVPSNSTIDRFDELRIVFHQPAGQKSRSMSVRIERFVLQPRA